MKLTIKNVTEDYFDPGDSWEVTDPDGQRYRIREGTGLGGWVLLKWDGCWDRVRRCKTFEAALKLIEAGADVEDEEYEVDLDAIDGEQKAHDSMLERHEERRPDRERRLEDDLLNRDRGFA